jgi:MOSC domain-containing protein YiiM
MPRILSVNVGRPRLVDTGRRAVSTAIWKSPVEGRVAVRGVNIDGDDQADRSVHGGPDKAVYAYAIEETRRWEEELGRELGPGAFGENLTTEGIDVSGALVGERWRIGTTLLEVVQPRLPCFKLGLKMGDAAFLKRFGQASRPGAYLRIVEEGQLGAGDAIEVDVDALPDHGVTVRLISDAILLDHGLAAQVLDAPQLIPELREWMTEALASDR